MPIVCILTQHFAFKKINALLNKKKYSPCASLFLIEKTHISHIVFKKS